MPEQRILTGYNIAVLKLPPSGITGGEPGVSIILTEMQPPNNSIVYTIPEKVAKAVGQQLLGINKVETASPEEMQAILADHSRVGTGRN